MKDVQNNFEMRVRPKGRTPADEYPHKGQIWIEGRDNSWYEIELINRTPNTVMAVLSVDGVGVIDGEPAHYDSKGFVLNAGQTLRVPGWVHSAQSAAKFVFSTASKSYAAQMNQGQNPGVIGTAWFTQKPVVPVYPQLNVRSAWPITKGIQSHANMDITLQSGSVHMGTAWGDQTDFSIQPVCFDKSSAQPQAVLVLRYDHADNLKAMGIRLRDRVRYDDSQAFPANSPGYCKPPPVWVTTRK